MASDVMAVRLHLAQIRVLGVVEDTPGALVVSVESTLLRLRCAQCGFKCRRVHDRRAKRVRDLEVSGRRMTLVAAAQDGVRQLRLPVLGGTSGLRGRADRSFPKSHIYAKAHLQ